MYQVSPRASTAVGGLRASHFFLRRAENRMLVVLWIKNSGAPPGDVDFP